MQSFVSRSLSEFKWIVTTYFTTRNNTSLYKSARMLESRNKF